jgi:hypothetical protein
VDPAAIDAAKKSSGKKSEEKVKKVIPEPSIKFSKVSSTGELVGTFNQKMIFPAKIYPRVYKYIFLFSIISDLDGSKTLGRIVDKD